jgi:hypothetical protein
VSAKNCPKHKIPMAGFMVNLWCNLCDVEALQKTKVSQEQEKLGDQLLKCFAVLKKGYWAKSPFVFQRAYVCRDLQAVANWQPKLARASGKKLGDFYTAQVEIAVGGLPPHWYEGVYHIWSNRGLWASLGKVEAPQGAYIGDVVAQPRGVAHSSPKLRSPHYGPASIPRRPLTKPPPHLWRSPKSGTGVTITFDGDPSPTFIPALPDKKHGPKCQGAVLQGSNWICMGDCP